MKTFLCVMYASFSSLGIWKEIFSMFEIVWVLWMWLQKMFIIYIFEYAEQQVKNAKWTLGRQSE